MYDTDSTLLEASAQLLRAATTPLARFIYTRTSPSGSGESRNMSQLAGSSTCDQSPSLRTLSHSPAREVQPETTMVKNPMPPRLISDPHTAAIAGDNSRA